MKLDHINIKAPRELLEREKDFFCELLGLRVGPRPDFGSFGYWLYAGDEALVHLSERAAVAKDHSQGYFDHVALRAHGLAELLEKLASRDVEYKMAYLEERKMTQVFFRAPSNTRIEINFVGEKV
ncbi:MAG TPA: VOC family protein [Gammaproteobacteria bacterium]|nr:VOC family protein [Gammaproteobacteria bacterium]